MFVTCTSFKMAKLCVSMANAHPATTQSVKSQIHSMIGISCGLILCSDLFKLFHGEIKRKKISRA